MSLFGEGSWFTPESWFDGESPLPLSGGGTKTVAKTVDWNLEGYRYIDVRLKTTDANQSITIRLSHADGEDKSYTIQSGSADTFSVVRIDLCLPDDITDNDDTLDDDVYTQESRFPLEGSSSTVPQKSDATWGFNVADEIEITFPDGQTLTIDYIRLARKETSGWGEVSFLPAFQPFRAGWTDAEIKSQFWTNADGRVSDLAWQFKQSAGYGFFSITAAGDLMERKLGWDTMMLTTFPADGYHNNDLEALLLWGGGVIWSGGGDYLPGVDLSVATTKTIPAQALWDEVQVYPGAGNVWGPGTYGEITEIGAAKQLRGQMWGLVFDTGGTSPTSGAIVTLKTNPGGTTVGSGTTDGIGFYETGAPHGKKFSHKGFSGSLESPAFTVYNRLRHRRCWLVDIVSSGVAIAVRSDWYIAYGRINDSGTVSLRFAYAGQAPGDEIDTGQSAVNLSMAWDKGQPGRLVMALENSGGNINVVASQDEGEIWTLATTVASGPGNTYPALTITPDGVRHVYWISGGDTIKGRLYNSAMTAFGAAFTVKTGVDDSGLAVDNARAAGGVATIEMAHIESGAVVVSRSTDGETFV
ncbi:hypothetical protein CCB80_03320 [Armatimonadetes bacterium Uphvl-Ar1]|nr:hypothetical protein CCB80_03320 [Armatimonadetes bacterium Uphvl-Ar1]